MRYLPREVPNIYFNSIKAILAKIVATSQADATSELESKLVSRSPRSVTLAIFADDLGDIQVIHTAENH